MLVAMSVLYNLWHLLYVVCDIWYSSVLINTTLRRKYSRWQHHCSHIPVLICCLLPMFFRHSSCNSLFVASFACTILYCNILWGDVWQALCKSYNRLRISKCTIFNLSHCFLETFGKYITSSYSVCMISFKTKSKHFKWFIRNQW